MRTFLPALIIAIWATFFARAETTVLSPGTVPNSGTPFPFFATTNNGPSMRYQQVYTGSDFRSYGDVQYLITAISLNAGSVFGPQDVMVPNLQIRFSTTQKAPDGLSSTFSQNVGADDMVVFSGSFDFTKSSFEWHNQINLQHPFLFDPRAGNLLLDVRNFQTVPPFPVQPPGQWNASSVTTAGDTTSQVSAFNVNSTTATYVTSEGLSTLFTVTQVPEPGSVLLMGTGFCAVALLALRRRFLPGHSNPTKMKGNPHGPN